MASSAVYLPGQWPKAGCRSSASHETFRRELLRQAMADRSRLKIFIFIVMIIIIIIIIMHDKT